MACSVEHVAQTFHRYRCLPHPGTDRCDDAQSSPATDTDKCDMLQVLERPLFPQTLSGLSLVMTSTAGVTMVCSTLRAVVMPSASTSRDRTSLRSGMPSSLAQCWRMLCLMRTLGRWTLTTSESSKPYRVMIIISICTSMHADKHETQILGDCIYRVQLSAAFERCIRPCMC